MFKKTADLVEEGTPNEDDDDCKQIETMHAGEDECQKLTGVWQPQCAQYKAVWQHPFPTHLNVWLWFECFFYD